jgi:hypothetical protein
MEQNEILWRKHKTSIENRTEDGNQFPVSFHKSEGAEIAQSV